MLKTSIIFQNHIEIINYTKIKFLSTADDESLSQLKKFKLDL